MASLTPNGPSSLVVEFKSPNLMVAGSNPFTIDKSEADRMCKKNVDNAKNSVQTEAARAARAQSWPRPRCSKVAPPPPK